METEQQIFKRLQREHQRELARRSWAKLSKRERSERARRAVNARWKKAKKKAT
jgi:hypothetical protein